MLQFIGLQLLISNYGHLPYNMLFIFGIFFQINRLNFHLWSWCLDLEFQIMWGCPTFVLDLKLHDEKKLPKCSPRSRLGCFIGYSSSHSSTLSLILNLQTGIVRPQYHLVHDDWFSTVINSLSSSLSSALWDIISIGYEHEDYDLSGAKDTWHDSETSTLREVSRRGREMYA